MSNFEPPAQPEKPEEELRDEQAFGAAFVEATRNAKLIDWGYWADRKALTVQQAAMLVHSVDPIRQRGDSPFAQGTADEDLRHGIQATTEWLAERGQSWTLGALVHVLGESVPFGMREAVAPKRSGFTSPSAHDWKEAARQIADALFDRDTVNSVRDSLAGYAERTMKELRQRQIHGPRGPIDNAATVQRDALQGPKWWGQKVK